jgi:hypothetical protein
MSNHMRTDKKQEMLNGIKVEQPRLILGAGSSHNDQDTRRA